MRAVGAGHGVVALRERPRRGDRAGRRELRRAPPCASAAPRGGAGRCRPRSRWRARCPRPPGRGCGTPRGRGSDGSPGRSSCRAAARGRPATSRARVRAKSRLANVASGSGNAAQVRAGSRRGRARAATPRSPWSRGTRRARAPCRRRSRRGCRVIHCASAVFCAAVRFVRDRVRQLRGRQRRPGDREHAHQVLGVATDVGARTRGPADRLEVDLDPRRRADPARAARRSGDRRSGSGPASPARPRRNRRPSAPARATTSIVIGSRDEPCGAVYIRR